MGPRTPLNIDLVSFWQQLFRLVLHPRQVDRIVGVVLYLVNIIEIKSYNF